MKCLISSNSLSLVNKFAARTRSWVRNSGPSTTDPGETDPWIVQPNLNSLTRRSGAARGDSAVRPEESDIPGLQLTLTFNSARCSCHPGDMVTVISWQIVSWFLKQNKKQLHKRTQNTESVEDLDQQMEI
jgi:hypothetical protein